MATKLTRCLCGKIFDPAENAVCPACGAEQRNEVQPAQPPPETAPAKTELRVTRSEPLHPPQSGGGGEKREIHFSFSVRQLVQFGGGAVAAVAIAVIVWWLLHRPPHENPTGGTVAKIEDSSGRMNGDIAKKADPKIEPQPTPTPTPTPAPDPAAPKNWVADAENGKGTDGADLGAIIEMAKDGDTITLKPGTYSAGFHLDKKIRIAGEKAEPDRFVITTKGQKRPTRITAVGATLANLQFVQDESATGPAFMVENDSDLTIEGCALKLSHAIGIMARSPAKFTMTNCTFTTGAARTMLLRGPSKVTMTQCIFTGGVGAISAEKEAQLTMRGCKFQNIGDKEAKESAISISGAGVSIVAEDCTFSGCRMPLQAEEGASLALTKCTLTGNGVRGEKGDFTKGVISVSKRASLTLKDVTFEGNMQGINLYQEGTAEVADCKFTNGGLLVQDTGFMNFCVPLRIYGEGAKATVLHSTFAQSKPHAIFMEDGASISVDDSEFAGTQFVGLMASRTPEMKPGAASEVIVKKSRFSGNAACMFLTAAKATVEGCEFRNNGSGLSATGAGTTVNVTGGVVAGQKDFGFLITSDAALTLSGVSFEENQHGLQLGVAGKPAEKGTALIEECKFKGSMDADVLAYQPSKVTMRLCEFDPAEGAKVKREKGALIESDPPIMGIVDIGKKGASGGGSTASNNKGTPSKGRSTPSRSQPQPSDTIRNIINSVDRMRRIFR